MDDDLEGVMEVALTDSNGDEFIYWVDITQMPDDEDEYDWPIQESLKFHAKKIGTAIDEDFCSEPFSRPEDEYVWVNK